MASNVRVEMNRSGARALLTGPEIRTDLRRRGRAVARAAGPGFEVFTQDQRTARAGVVVMPVTAAARRAQARDRTLNRALDAGKS